MENALTIPDDATAITAVFDDLGENTKRTYLSSWESFANFLDVPTVSEAVARLITSGQGGANFIAMRYRKHLLDTLAPSTAKTRLGALCGVIKRCRRIGLVNWSLDIESISTNAQKGLADNPVRGFTTGQANDMAKIFAAIDLTTALGTRDTAIIELLYNPALRRFECGDLDVSDIDWVKSRLNIRGKGRDEDEWINMPESARRAIIAWMNFRGQEPGPLFVRLDRATKDTLARLSDSSIYNIVVARAAKVGITAWPHALRHTGITDVAVENNGNMVATAGFGRHKSMTTTMGYINNINDQAKAASNAIDRLRA